MKTAIKQEIAGCQRLARLQAPWLCATTGSTWWVGCICAPYPLPGTVHLYGHRDGPGTISWCWGDPERGDQLHPIKSVSRAAREITALLAPRTASDAAYMMRVRVRARMIDLPAR